MTNHLNVLNQPLKPCCNDPVTGYYRNGFCQTGKDDFGNHIICVLMTEDFLAYSKNVGNDLSTPRPEFDFRGCIPGDKWCVCITRWVDAYEDGVIAPVFLESSHIKCLDYIDLTILKKHAYTS